LAAPGAAWQVQAADFAAAEQMPAASAAKVAADVTETHALVVPLAVSMVAEGEEAPLAVSSALWVGIEKDSARAATVELHPCGEGPYHSICEQVSADPR
jgi:hypothetical protein